MMLLPHHTAYFHAGWEWLIPCGGMLTLFNSFAAHVEHTLDVPLNLSLSNCIQRSLSILVTFSIFSRTRESCVMWLKNC